jgi:hypothetical protein
VRLARANFHSADTDTRGQAGGLVPQTGQSGRGRGLSLTPLAGVVTFSLQYTQMTPACVLKNADFSMREALAAITLNISGPTPPASRTDAPQRLALSLQLGDTT